MCLAPFIDLLCVLAAEHVCLTLQAPVFILIIQLLFAAITVKGCAVCGVLEAEPLRWSLVRPFLLIVAGFLGTL